MQQSDFQRFRAVMTGMAKVYERELDALLLDAYWVALRDWSLEDFERAAGELMRTNEFMPRPAAFNALRKAATKLLASEAWFTKGTSDDPLANRAMQIATQGKVNKVVCAYPQGVAFTHRTRAACSIVDAKACAADAAACSARCD